MLKTELFMWFFGALVFIGVPITIILMRIKKKKATESLNKYQQDFDSGNYENCIRVLRKQFYSMSFDTEEKQANIDVMNKLTTCLDKMNVKHSELTEPAITFLNKYLHIDSDNLNDKDKETYTEMNEKSIKPIVRFLNAMEKGKSVNDAMQDAYKKGMLD
jgi:hypothetical protein